MPDWSGGLAHAIAAGTIAAAALTGAAAPDNGAGPSDSATVSVQNGPDHATDAAPQDQGPTDARPGRP